MKLLIILLLSPAILAQRYEKSNDPNDEPFLPVFPVYPYNPKLIKRGIERETTTHLTAELYAPKVDAKDSYSASFSSNYPRDPYYPNYNPYPSSLSYPYTSAAYNAYNSYSSPYSMNSPQYSTIPYSAPYPSYYYQPPYYYPNYYNQPLLPPPPPPPPATDYPSSTDSSYNDSESRNDDKEKKPNRKEKTKDADSNQDSGNQYVDGGNFVSGNSKDLDGQPSTYKVNSPQNQLESVNNIPLKNLPMLLPQTTYRVVSVAGQPVGPDYPLPPSYAKAQQLEELMAQTWLRFLNKNSQQQGTQYSTYEENKNVKVNDGVYGNQNEYNKESHNYLSIPNIIAKTGLAYVINPSLLGKVNGEQQTGQFAQTPTPLMKITKYAPLPRVNLDQSSGPYVSPDKPEKDEIPTDMNDYSYDNQSSQGPQVFDNPLGQVDNKQGQKYEDGEGQAVSYQNQNFVTVQTPRPYTYRYTKYNPSQLTTQQQTQQYQTNLEDVNFGAKQVNKG